MFWWRVIRGGGDLYQSLACSSKVDVKTRHSLNQLNQKVTKEYLLVNIDFFVLITKFALLFACLSPFKGNILYSYCTVGASLKYDSTLYLYFPYGSMRLI